MRQDGSFEGRIYGLESESTSESAKSLEPFKMCGVTETLRPLKEIVDEELYRLRLSSRCLETALPGGFSPHLDNIELRDGRTKESSLALSPALVRSI